MEDQNGRKVPVLKSPIQMHMHCNKDGTCNIKINDERFSRTLHAEMINHIYRHVCYCTTRNTYNENAVAMMMILIEEEIYQKLHLEVMVVPTTEGLDAEEIQNYYMMFQIQNLKVA